jgi:hypothetical protein
MNNGDKLDAAIEMEERALLAAIREEPGFFSQASGVFFGSNWWVSLILMASQVALFTAGCWAAWHFFQAQDALAALRWGLPAAVLLIVSLMLKLAFWPQIQANRVIREIRRLELVLRAED